MPIPDKFLLMKTIKIAAAALALLAFALPATAYRLPHYRIALGDRDTPAEEVLSRLKDELGDLEELAGRGRLEEHHRNPKVRLGPKARRAVGRGEELRRTMQFWRKVVKLKGDLVALQGKPPDPGAVAEADAMAKGIVERIYAISEEYRIVMSALFQNFLVNAGTREKGHCYHYVEDLRRALAVRPWSWYELHWGVSWAGTFRENNALVITARGAPFERGLAVDAWRSGGRPFWTRVEGDRFPWVEAAGMERDGQSGALFSPPPPTAVPPTLP